MSLFINMEESKICRSCGKSKPLSQYYNNKLMKSGKANSCKICSGLGIKVMKNDIPKFNKEYSKFDDNWGKLFAVTSETYSLMYEFLSKIGYDTSKDIHQQFLDRWNPESKKPMKYKKRSACSINFYLPNGEKNITNKKLLREKKYQEQKKSPPINDEDFGL